ncbi:hypothetical protein A9Q79_08765 [Methylophaga sp. 42_25_T18]|nr:hypothetical protein A9Q79_08765 [Methylophaga sp. 42_25_T18]OUR87756.1 hypothetical protein A9Q92_03895 [Methylophaga sp. 42_8_T64]
MKQLVNSLQYVVVLIVIYPVYYIWETDKVTHFCEQVETGMSKERFVQLSRQASVRMIGPQDESLVGGKWQALIAPGMFISADECVVRGAGQTVATARLFER